MSDDEKLAEAVMEHLGPAALTGGKMSILEAFEAGWKAGHASRDAEVERNTAIACYEIACIGFNRADSEWTMDEIAREFHLD